MKKLCFCLVLGLTSLSAEIVETFHFSKILITSHLIRWSSWMLTIILLLPRQTLGSDVWFIHRMAQQLKNLGAL